MTLVGAAGQCQRYREPERLGGREVDEELHLHHLLDRQISRLGTAEDLAGVDARLPVAIGEIGSVAHQPACLDELAPHVNCGHRMAGRQRDDLSTLVCEQRVGADDECVGVEFDKGSEGPVDLARRARRQDMQL
jgi:hypothetical protein